MNAYYEVSAQGKRNGEQRTYGKNENVWDVTLRACLHNPEWTRPQETADNCRKTFKRYEKSFMEAHGKVKKLCEKRSGAGGEGGKPLEAQKIVAGTKLYGTFEKWVEVRGYLSPQHLIESRDGGAGARQKKPEKRELIKAAERYMTFMSTCHSYSKYCVACVGKELVQERPRASGKTRSCWTYGRSDI